MGICNRRLTAHFDVWPHICSGDEQLRVWSYMTLIVLILRRGLIKQRKTQTRDLFYTFAER